MNPRLKIAVVGAGLIGRRHIELIAQSTECELCAIVDPDLNHADVPIYRSLSALFTAQRPDGVILATPNALHVSQTLECLAACVPTLVEKPVAHSLDEGERLCHAVEASNVPILVGHHRVHSSLLAQARSIIQDGILGQLVAVTGSAMFYKPEDYFSSTPWRRELGAGPVFINMIHEVGNLRSLCGEITAVQAFGSNEIRGFAVDDTVAINLRFANGALGTFMLSDTAASACSWEQTSQEDSAYPSYDDDCYVIAGTAGSLAVPTMRLKTYPSVTERSWWQPFQTDVLAIERNDPLAQQLIHFCAVIRGEASPLVTVQDGLQNLRVVDAIHEATRSGHVVYI